MRKYDSSINRIRPLMNVVENKFQAFQQLLKLVNISGLGMPLCYCYDGENNKEKKLKPSYKHLYKLIDYVAENNHDVHLNNSEKRQKLFAGDPATLEKAHEELKAKYNSLTASSREWYILEGFSHPDIFIEGDDYIIVCEGKWTERGITTHTTYLPYRNQIVRHIQGALNYSDKKVYAFYIVDKELGKDYLKDLTKNALKEQLSKETIKLEAKEEKEILDAFYGYTTWQEIQKAIDVKFKTKQDIDKE